MAESHKPVMLEEMLVAMEPKDGCDYLDCTFGSGGYSRALLDKALCKVHGIDRDPMVSKYAEAFVEKYSNKSVIFGSSHNGYSSFFKKLIHKRTFKIYEDNFMIKDEIYGDFKKAIVRFFLHPDIKIQKNSFINF